MEAGEQAAAVIPRTGASPDTDEIAESLRSYISRHKVPEYWQVVDSFPLNAPFLLWLFKLYLKWPDKLTNANFNYPSTMKYSLYKPASQNLLLTSIRLKVE